MCCERLPGALTVAGQRGAATKMPPRTPLERYFTLHYAHTGDVCVARHHNGVCVVCLAPRHGAVAAGVRRVEYTRELRAVSGKRKRGGTVVQPDSVLCRVHAADGAEYDVHACVKGTLLEYNQALAADPGLAARLPLSDGYLAVVLPLPRDIDTAVDDLLDEKQLRNVNGAA